LLCAVIIAMAPLSIAVAQDIPVPAPTGYKGIAGIALVSLPDYEGSDDGTFAAAPVFQYKFSGERYIQVIGNKAFLNLIKTSPWEAGVKGVFRFGREGSDIDDSVVKLLPDVDDSAEVGGFVGYRYQNPSDMRNRANVHLDITQDVTDGHDGFVIEAAGVYWKPVSRMIDIGVRAGATYASANYMSSYFDVTAVGAAASGLPVFSADAGFKDVGIGVMAVLHWNKSWHTGFGVNYKKLLSDAADSPVVDLRGSSDQWIFGATLMYTWM
jgi:outer membrane protein